MKQLILNIPDNKYNYFLQELGNYDFVEIQTEHEFDIPEFHKGIIDKRLENIKNNPDCLLDWEDVQKDIEAKLK